MTLNEARTVLSKELKNIYDSDELKNIADLVLEYVTGLPRMEQIRSKKPWLTCHELENLDTITERLKQSEPVQYVLGEAWFTGMKFKVNKNVLIPRPETEELVDWIVKELNVQYSTPNTQCSMLDVGTGSGCIPIALKQKLPQAKISAVDVCSEALFTATENAVALEAYVNFILLDFLQEEKWNELDTYDVIVSNPPYVMQKEKDSMHKRVTSHEPSLALFVPDDDALIFYRKLADFSLLHLNTGGKLFVEINESLGKDVMDLFLSKGFAIVELRKDMQGKDRMIKATITASYLQAM